MWLAPKWTNAELVALMAARHVFATHRREPLKEYAPVFGPMDTRVPEVLDFTDVRPDPAYVKAYAEAQELPARLAG